MNEGARPTSGTLDSMPCHDPTSFVAFLMGDHQAGEASSPACGYPRCSMGCLGTGGNIAFKAAPPVAKPVVLGLLRRLAWFVYSDPRLELHMTLFALHGQLLTFGVEDRQRPRRCCRW